MPNKLIDEVWDLDSIKAQLQEYLGFLAAAKKGMQDLYDYQKSFKDTTISNLTDNTQQLSVVIGQAAASTNKASQANQGLADSIKAVVTAGTNLNETYAQASTSLDANIKTQIRYRAEVDNLQKSQKLLEAQISAVGNATDSQSAKQVELTKNILQVKAASSDLQNTIKNQIKEQTSASGSIDQMRASLNQLLSTYDKLGANGKASEGGKALQASIQQVTAALVEQETSTGRSQRKVGDYTGAVRTLQEQLELVNKQLAEMDQLQGKGVQNMGSVGFDPNKNKPGGTTSLAGATPGGLGFDPQRYKQLQGEAEALSVVIGRQEKGFMSLNQQVRASEQALQTLRAAGLEGSEGFEQLREKTTAAAQSQKEFTRQQKVLESEAPLLKAMTIAARGLAGAYAVGAGASALLANGDEKVEKELNKLVAIMTILQGLQEAYNIVQEGGAIMTTLRAAQTTILTTATEAYTYVTEEATAATIALDAALAATGIGAIVAAIVLLVQNLNTATKEERELADFGADLAASIDKITAAVVDQSEALNTSDQEAKKTLELKLALLEKSNASYFEQMAVKKEIADLDVSMAEKNIKSAGGAEDLSEAYRNVQKEIDGYKKSLKELKPVVDEHQSLFSVGKQLLLHQVGEDPDDVKKRIDEAAESYNKDVATYKGLIEKKQKLLDDYNNYTREKAGQSVEITTFTTKEQVELEKQGATARAQAIIQNNGLILANEASTQAQRVAAERSTLRETIAVINAELKAKLADPSLTPGGRALAEHEAQANRVKEIKTGNEAVRKTNLDYALRDKADRMEIYRQANQESQKYEAATLAKKIGPEEGGTTAQAKLQALGAQFQEQKNLIEQNRQYDLSALGLDNEDKLKINAKYDSDLRELELKHVQDQLVLNKEIKQSLLDENDRYYENRKTQLDKESDLELDALNKRLEAGNISRRKYADEARKIEEKNALETINIRVNSDYVHVASTKDGTKERADAEKQLQADLAAQSMTRKNNFIADQDADLKKVQDTSEKIAAVSENASNAVAAAWDIGFRTQQVDLQNLEKRQERAYTVQQKQIQDTSASQEQKSLRLKILDEQKAAQDTKNARKQRQLDIEKAKFDRDKSIFDIIIGGEVAVVKALPNIPLAVSVGVLAAAELAAAISVPLPKYYKGTKNHPGGPAVVGDAYRPELIIEPGQEPYMSPGVPTVLDLAARTQVIAADEIERMIGSGMFVNNQGVIKQRDQSGDIKQVRDAIVWQTMELKKTIAKNRPRIVTNIKLDAKFGEHIHKSVFK